MMSFFFQAEDGIRDDLVTGVQTCALPISGATHRGSRPVEIHDELPQVPVPALVLANELLGAAQLRPGKHLGEAPAELLRLVLPLERPDPIPPPALPFPQGPRAAGPVGKRQAPDAGLLVPPQ